jgi:hypothetical protein
MRRVWSGAVLVIVVLGVGALGTPAEAGGSTFNFNRRWFAPGQEVVGRAQFSDSVRDQGRIADGPYFAYLVRGDRLIDPPRVPRDAIPLSRVRMRAVGPGIWEASIRFVVPDVLPGIYTVSLCNDPCRNAFVGDLMGAWISVVASPEQAKMKNLEAGIEERITEQMSLATSGLEDRVQSLSDAVDAEASRTMSVAAELRLDKLDEQIERLTTEVRHVRGHADQGLIAWLWLAGWVVAGSIAAAWWRSRRPRPQPHGSAEEARSRRRPPRAEESELPFRTSSEASTRTPGARRAVASGVGGDV